MSHNRTAKEFFETYIPKNTLDKIDLESIKHEKESFIDKDLGDGVVDALFSVSLTNGEPGYLYILVEHQTDQEHFMAFRLWKYILRIIERHIKQHPKDKMLPYVLPIVLYTGTAGYRVAHSFFDLFYDPEFARELLTGAFKVVELNNVSDHELKKRLYSGVMQLMLKNIRLPDILPFLEGISGLIRFCRIKVYLLYWDFIILSYCHMSIISKAFRRLHYPIDVIALCVRCYLSYSLSLRNIEEMMAERGITLDHSTLHRWVVRLIPLMNKTFRKYKRQTRKHWRMHETYIKVKGKWQYLYRAVDKYGKTIDFLLTARRDTAAALRFFKKAISQHGVPEVVTIDKSGANTAALKVINKDKPEKEAIGILQNKYLNNMIEQDHRNIKRRIRPMLGFKSFRFAKIILGGIELIHMIRKGQFQHPGGTGLSNAQQFYLLAA